MKKWWKNTAAKKGKLFGFLKVEKESKTTFYDKKTVDYLESELPNPTQKQFTALIENTASIIISKMEVNNSTRQLEPKTVAEIKEPEQLKASIEKFEIKDESSGHLMTIGDYRFDFITSTGQKITVEYLGEGCIRLAKYFKNDAELKQPDAFLEWLNSIGITQPWQDLQDSKQRQAQQELRFQEWKKVAPKAMANKIDKFIAEPSIDIVREVYIAMQQEITDDFERLLKIFEVFGHGAHEWNVLTMYDSLPQTILMGTKMPALNRIYNEYEVKDVHKEGMGRLLASWDFHEKRKEELADLSPDLKQDIYSYLVEKGEKVKIEQFKKMVLSE